MKVTRALPSALAIAACLFFLASASGLKKVLSSRFNGPVPGDGNEYGR